jgi:hypothetical protein
MGHRNVARLQAVLWIPDYWGFDYKEIAILSRSQTAETHPMNINNKFSSYIG